MSEDIEKYEVGYGRPPSHTRFEKGQSGNPKGRPKGVKNFKTIVLEILNEKIFVTENGRTREITKGEAVVRQQVNKAASGDHAAIRETIRLYAVLEQLPDEVVAEDGFTENDHAVLEGLRRRVQAATQQADSGKKER